MLPRTEATFWFPGRWIGGVTMILAPLLLLSGVLLRIRYHFFFPQQLAAFQENPRLLSAAYGAFGAGIILLWPAIAALTVLIGRTRPAWAMWGGLLVTLGLFARTFNAGIDHLAFQLVQAGNLDLATQLIAKSYGTFRIVLVLSPAILTGWIVLAIGAYLSGTMGRIRAIALSLMSALMIGVLKGTGPSSLIAIGGLVVALVPQGWILLREGPVPSVRKVLLWSFLTLVLLTASYFVGQAG